MSSLPPLNTESSNVARRLAQYASEMVDVPAVVMTRRKLIPFGKRRYAVATFAELETDSDRIARGLREYGVVRGTRLALLVKPSIEFVTLVFALLKVGATSILIDPGMGRKNLLKCLADAEPEGFVAIPAAQAVRSFFRERFPRAQWNVTVGRKLYWDGITLDAVRALGEKAATSDDACAAMRAQDPAAIIFTTGSTGPPKGVLYSHGNFDRQVEEIRDGYGIRAGEVNVACFPLFGLFNAAMGVTTVVPRMDASRPAKVNPKNIINAVNDWRATQSFASPAVWDKVGRYCTTRGIRLPTLREAYSAGAPVPPKVIERMTACLADGGRLHTPYGATEALPVSTIASPEILGETAKAWAAGRGTCVGRAFPGIERRVIRIVDGPIADIAQTERLPVGEIGELIVRGAVVTASYATRTEANAQAKITDGETFWHRMGDTGYLDAQDRFWFCGRVAHRVRMATGTRYTDPCEGVFNQHSSVLRSALVGVGPIGEERPVIVCELVKGRTVRTSRLEAELREMARKNPITFGIVNFLFHPALPVDIRHNSKIFREKLAVWAAEKLGVPPRAEP
ncbi:MAG: AMP-binding protein [Planctomycetia bacterium]|nr:AMP-binding protein [Planctomycetia bacterium]